MTRIARMLPVVAALGAAIASAPARAQDGTDVPGAFTVSGNVTLASEYRFRGVSQTGGDPAIQGAITVTHESGLYVGAWASNVGFHAVGPVTQRLYGSVEVDLLAGWSGDVVSGLTADVGGSYYTWPDGRGGAVDYGEVYGSLARQLGPARLKVGANYAWKQAGLGHDDNFYTYANVDVGIPSTPLTLTGHLGHTTGALAPDWLAGGTRRSGFDWSVGAIAALPKGLSLGLSWMGTQGANRRRFTDNAVVATLSYGF